ncbi:unnamed protein product [Cyprideis torosa]|uniref:Ferrochelatase n=1 Tax=Cyprideis torosa TaxID=163714 RepID=A0A7R8WW67_9CRUS|nr:unnamed protein product [Cyprideis torosa]CAG0907132.1 unnamed protein product [Cyprideis torosa]
MRYWHPRAEEALATFAMEDITRIVALPLYPHFSRATSGSSLKDLHEASQKSSQDFSLLEIPSWPDNPLYIESLAGNIREGLRQFDGKEATIVFSAHSLPVSFIEEGDPYLDHLQKTLQALEEQTGISGKLCFQSRSGPVEWLAPSTEEMLGQLAQNGCKNVLMVPISFVSDHVETLYEIDMLYRDMAKQLGMTCFSSPSLNTGAPFIAALKNLVLQRLEQA